MVLSYPALFPRSRVVCVQQNSGIRQHYSWNGKDYFSCKLSSHFWSIYTARYACYQFIGLVSLVHVSFTESTPPFYSPLVTRESLRMPAFVKTSLAWFRQQLPSLDPKDMLPLGIDIQTGAIILGNPSTPNLLVAEFRNALGTYGIVPVCC